MFVRRAPKGFAVMTSTVCESRTSTRSTALSMWARRLFGSAYTSNEYFTSSASKASPL